VREYTYTDHFDGHRIVFVCEAVDILAADKLYFAVTGNRAEKQTQVGCSIRTIREGNLCTSV